MTLLGIISGLLKIATLVVPLIAAWRSEQTGRREARLESLEEERANVQKANEIDSRPVPDDRDDILSRL
jgi:hypothetical protein